MPLSFQQKQKFTSKPEDVAEEFSFDGGLVTDVHETKLQLNQSPDLGDILFNNSKSIDTRDGYLRYNGTPIGATSDQSNTGSSVATVSLSSANGAIAQTFQPSGDISVTQVDLYLAMNTTGEQQYVQAQLWATSSSEPSTILTNGIGQILQISGTSETTYSFRFREPVELSASTTYALVLVPFIRGSTQTINTVLAHRTGAAYANGEIYTSADDGLTWTAQGNDLKFVVYSGGDTGSTGLLRYYGDGVTQLLAKFGDTYYRGNDVTGAMTAITMGNGITPATDNYIDYTIVDDTLLLVDNSNYILKYRGSTNAAYTTGTITVTNASSTVTGSGTSWSTSTNAEVGEYIQLPDSKWYKITAIASDTSLTIEAKYYGTTLSAQSYIISPWGVVQGRFNDGAATPTSEAVANLVRPQPAFIENHVNRVWTLTGNALRFSALATSISGEHFNDWDTSSNAGEIIVPDGDGDSGTGLYSLGGSLYVFQRHAIWRVYGTRPTDFELRNVTNELGMVSQKTLVEWNDLLIFQATNGIYLFDGSNTKNISEGIVNTTISGFANQTSPVATLWDNKYILSFSENGQPANNKALFYDLARGIWGICQNVYASAWTVWKGGNDTGQVYFASSNQGSIYQWAIGGHDDGYTIDSYYETPALGYSSGMNDKTLKRYYVQQLALGDWDVLATMYTDLGQTTTTGDPINLSPGNQTLWDVGEFDVDEWSGEGEIITSRIAEFNGLGKYFKFRLEQSGYQEGMTVLGMTSMARPRRLR